MGATDTVNNTIKINADAILGEVTEGGGGGGADSFLGVVVVVLYHEYKHADGSYGVRLPRRR